MTMLWPELPRWRLGRPEVRTFLLVMSMRHTHGGEGPVLAGLAVLMHQGALRVVPGGLLRFHQRSRRQRFRRLILPSSDPA
jgi:hypothetical protein